MNAILKVNIILFGRYQMILQLHGTAKEKVKDMREKIIWAKEFKMNGIFN